MEKLLILLVLASITTNPLGIYFISGDRVAEVGSSTTIHLAIKNISDSILEGSLWFFLITDKYIASEKWTDSFVTPESMQIKLMPGETIFVNVTVHSNTTAPFYLVARFDDYEKTICRISFISEKDAYRVHIDLWRAFILSSFTVLLIYIIRAVEKDVVLRRLRK